MSILAQAGIQDLAHGPGLLKRKIDTVYCKRCVIVHHQWLNNDTPCGRAKTGRLTLKIGIFPKNKRPTKSNNFTLA